MSIGYYQYRTRSRSKTHAVQAGIPVCGTKLEPKYFQFCAPWNLSFDMLNNILECKKCIKWIKQWRKARGLE